MQMYETAFDLGASPLHGSFFRLLLLNVWRSCDFAVNYLRLLILALIPFLKHMIWYSIIFKEIPYGNSFLASLFRISLPERCTNFSLR